MLRCECATFFSWRLPPTGVSSSRARYLLTIFAHTPAAEVPRRVRLITDFSADVARLLAELKHPRVAGDARRATASIISNRIAIAKGQQHGNREAKKPQKQKPKIHDLRWDLQFAIRLRVAAAAA